MKKLKIYSSLLVLTVVFCLISCSSGSSPSDAIIKTYDYVKLNKAKKAVAMYVTKKGEKLSEDEIKKMVGFVAMANADMETKGGLKNIEITEETIKEDGNSASVKYIINYNNGEIIEQDSRLIKIDNKWLITI